MKFSVLLPILASALLIAVVLASPRDPETNPTKERVPVIVELFTSEGCSSCPPADKLLTRLMNEQPVAGAEIIGLSEHVDYWNRLGWADPFSHARFSKRQQDYSRQRWPGRVYTPQMVIDGNAQFVGSDAGDAHASIEAAARQSKAEIEIKILPRDSSGVPVSVRIGEVPTAKGSIDAVLAITEDDLSVNVLRGENRSRKLIHSGVVREWRGIGSIDAGKNAAFEWSETLRLSPDWDLEKLRAVVFIQQRPLRRVLGAAATRLSPDEK